jgi:hypothetical protein
MANSTEGGLIMLGIIENGARWCNNILVELLGSCTVTKVPESIRESLRDAVRAVAHVSDVIADHRCQQAAANKGPLQTELRLAVDQFTLEHQAELERAAKSTRHGK